MECLQGAGKQRSVCVYLLGRFALLQKRPIGNDICKGSPARLQRTASLLLLEFQLLYIQFFDKGYELGEIPGAPTVHRPPSLWDLRAEAEKECRVSILVSAAKIGLALTAD